MTDLLKTLNALSAPQLRRLLIDHLTRQKLVLYWEAGALEHRTGGRSCLQQFD